jgi:hypothetical protein
MSDQWDWLATFPRTEPRSALETLNQSRYCDPTQPLRELHVCRILCCIIAHVQTHPDAVDAAHPLDFLTKRGDALFVSDSPWFTLVERAAVVAEHLWREWPTKATRCDWPIQDEAVMQCLGVGLFVSGPAAPHKALHQHLPGAMQSLQRHTLLLRAALLFTTRDGLPYAALAQNVLQPAVDAKEWARLQLLHRAWTAFATQHYAVAASLYQLACSEHKWHPTPIASHLMQSLVDFKRVAMPTTIPTPPVAYPSLVESPLVTAVADRYAPLAAVGFARRAPSPQPPLLPSSSSPHTSNDRRS